MGPHRLSGPSRSRRWARRFKYRRDGTGFRLSIVRETVTGHGWSIGGVEGEAGSARFVVRDVDVLDG